MDETESINFTARTFMTFYIATHSYSLCEREVYVYIVGSGRFKKAKKKFKKKKKFNNKTREAS